MMRIGLLMPISSPWCRQIGFELSHLGCSVHVIDFASQSLRDPYLRITDPFQASSIAALQDRVASIDLLTSRFRSRLRYLSCPSALRRICRQHDIQILLSLYGGGWGALACFSRVRPYAVYTVGSDVLASGLLSTHISRYALNRAAIVFANGCYLAEQTIRFAPRARVVPLVIGVDVERFSPCPVAPEPVKILCTRGFLPVYNNAYLIEGLAELGDTDKNIRTTFVSSGPRLDEVRSLAKRALSPEMNGRVAFLGGVTDEELMAELQSSHIYVSLSRSDGTSISLLEALSCGLFPVLSDIPQNREWVDPDQHNGLLVPLDRPRALAEALRKAVDDSELRAKAAGINRRLIVERADLRSRMSELVSMLKSLIT